MNTHNIIHIHSQRIASCICCEFLLAETYIRPWKATYLHDIRERLIIMTRFLRTLSTVRYTLIS